MLRDPLSAPRPPSVLDRALNVLKPPGGRQLPWTKPYVIWEVGRTRIGVIGAKAMATALATNTTLTMFELNDNGIEDVGADAPPIPEEEGPLRD